MKKKQVIILPIIALLIMGSLFLVNKANSSNEKDNEVTEQSSENNFIDIENQPILGEEDATVTIVEFGDFKCPDCGVFINDIFPQLKEDYIDTGKVNFVSMHFPFVHEDSTRAAIFTEGVFRELGNDAFWEINEQLYQVHQEIYTEDDRSNVRADIYTEEFLMSMANDLFGDDASELDNILSDAELKEEVNRDFQIGESLEVSKVPTLFVNEKIIVEKIDYESLKETIENELNK
ncbi:thioredoxin domain-containing protein [Bacillus carboniphilus]|uniref:Thioredoxin domain-containing protein n=1 Tax=Bacillus carboniphilus TaxID=86663 RepID=A0ABY9JX89_9BACI|nr:thioredoxin domain-containing protein [Bacillus carboniphilus]WLR42230.1 thioredoxin domain-containing protein [Bacillus carboniphilus]